MIQRIVATLAIASMAVSASGRPWEYVGALTYRLKLFSESRHDVRLVLVGDSRQRADPRLFYQPEQNRETPIALNVSTGSLGFDTQELLIRQYLIPHAPALDWIVWQFSPRLMNTYYPDGLLKQFVGSAGYRHDKAYPEAWSGSGPAVVPDERGWVVLLVDLLQVRDWSALGKGVTHERLWPRLSPAAQQAAGASATSGKAPSAPEAAAIVDALNAFIDPSAPLATQRANRLTLEELLPGALRPARPPGAPWGWYSELQGQTDPAKVEALLRAASVARFDLDSERWERLERLVHDLQRRNVKLLLYVSPMHYGLARANAADDDGTGHAAYRALMRKFEELSSRQPNVFFIDLHRGGRNDFRDDEYFNWDHLNSRGAVRLAGSLERLRRSVDSPPQWSAAPEQVPAALAGLKMLRTAGPLAFRLEQPSRVWIAHDEATLTKPSWLDDFTWTFDFITAGSTRYRLASRDFPAGAVTLGDGPGEYLVLVEPRGIGDARR